MRSAQVRPDQIVPVDSEHSAIAQCLRGGRREEVRRLVLTASGGPFRGRSRDDVKAVTAEQALAHPTWSMGPVVTVNSATLVNKGLELIEAHLLFDVPVADIAVVVHPQSVVHSMVEFVDGSTIAQASPPDMRLPIALGLSWPDRLDPVTPPCDWTRAATWTFEPLDEEVFSAVRLAREAVAASATHPAVLNAANEECVAAFLAGRIGYPRHRRHRRARARPSTTGARLGQLALDAVLAAEGWAGAAPASCSTGSDPAGPQRADQRRHRAGHEARPTGEALLGVGERHRAQARVDAEPPQGLGLPARRAVADPRQVHERGVQTEREVGERAPGEVRGADTVAHVAAGRAEPGHRVQRHRRVPVPRDAERAAPAVRDRGCSGSAGEGRAGCARARRTPPARESNRGRMADPQW